MPVGLGGEFFELLESLGRGVFEPVGDGAGFGEGDVKRVFDFALAFTLVEKDSDSETFGEHGDFSWG